MDGLVRVLERKLLQDPENKFLKYQLRRSYFLADRTDILRVEPGDIVEVFETESPWVQGYWLGLVICVMKGGDKYVRPLGQCDFRVVPNAEYQARGLYLTRGDICTLAKLHDPDYVDIEDYSQKVPDSVRAFPVDRPPRVFHSDVSERILTPSHPQGIVNKLKRWLGLGS